MDSNPRSRFTYSPFRTPTCRLREGPVRQNRNHPFATGYRAFEARFRRRVYRVTTGGFPLARYRRRRGWGDLRPSAYGTPRAMWCAPATIADGIEEFLEVKSLCMGGTDHSLTGLEARGER